ncbi:MAG: LamG-like jellyroll fold domain-containing protein, partial [Limisphaerales bacterium]
TAQGNYSVSGAIDYSGPQVGDLIIRAWPVNAENKTLKLDGSGDYIKTDLTDLSGTEITIQYWFKGVSNQSAVRIQNGGSWIVAGWNGKHILQNDDGVNGVSIGDSYNDGEWHHITLSWKKNTEGGFASYVDGELVSSRNSSDNDIPNHEAPVYIGAFNGLGEFTSGSLDEVVIWSRALTAEEIKTNWNKKLTGEEDGIIAFWDFESEEELLDLGPNAYESEYGGDAKVESDDIPKMSEDFVQSNFQNTDSYILKNVKAGNNYRVFSFIDVNGNNVADLNEPFGEFGELIDISKDMVNINIKLKEAPIITEEPKSVKKSLGETISLNVKVAGTEPMEYVWRFNNEDIEESDRITGTRSETLIINDFRKLDEGIYTVVVVNEIGSIESSGTKVEEFIEGFKISGVVTYNGEVDKNSVLSLDGDGDYVKTPLTNLSGDELTIQYWFRGDSLQSAVRQQSSGWIVAGWNGKHILQNDEGVNGVNIGEDVLDGKWHHVTLTWKRNTELGFSSYVDGNLVESRDSSDVPIPDYKTNVYFGSFNGVGEFTNGQLDEIAIWNRALSAEEAKKSYKIQYTGEESGLIGYWNFEDGGAKDLSGNNYDGELNGDAKIIEAVGIRGLPGKYELLNVIAGEDYVIESFVDLNGDGKKSPAEPFSISQPFNINEEISELNIELLDPVQITMQPNSISVAKSEDMKFSVDVIGTGPFTFQWFKNEKELDDNDRIFGADTDSIIIKNIELSDSGVYSVVVSNTISEIISDGALGTTISDNINEGLIAHWKLNGDDEDIFTAFDSSDNLLDAELMEYLEGDPEWWLDGKIDNALDFNNEIKQFAKVVGYENGSNALTISAWVLARSAESWGTVLKNWGDTKSGHFHFGLNSSGELSNFIGTSNGKTYSATEKQKFPINSWQHIATTVDGLSIKLYRNGELVAEKRYQGTLIENDLSSIGIGAKLNDDGTWVSQSGGGYWNGKFDDIGLWSRSLNHGEILGIYEAGIAGDDLSKADYVEIIDVPSDVALSINQLSKSKLEVTWYDKSNKYFLQSSTDLINWFNLDAQSNDSNGEKSLVIEKDQNMLFLRLYYK